MCTNFYFLHASVFIEYQIQQGKYFNANKVRVKYIMRNYVKKDPNILRKSIKERLNSWKSILKPECSMRRVPGRAPEVPSQHLITQKHCMININRGG